MTRWFEDIEINKPIFLGSHKFSLEEIIEFNKQYDNQYFHIDPELAKYSHFGGIIASGWHTACVGQRKMVDMLFAEEKRLIEEGKEPGVSGPSPGINNMRFRTPVRPGDEVFYQLTITSKRISNSLPGWGLLFLEIKATNQDNKLVYHADIVGLSKLRDFKPNIKQKLALLLMKVPLFRKLFKKK